MTAQAWRTLGLSVPVSEVLDPTLWRQRYAWGILSDPSTVHSGGVDLAKLITCKSRSKLSTPATEQEQCNRVTDQLTNETIRWHLRCGLSEVETRMGLPFGLVTYKSAPIDEGAVLGVDYDREYPRQTYLESEAREHYRFRVPGPLISVERVRSYWYDMPVWNIGPDTDTQAAIKIENRKAGEFHIMPSTLSTMLISSGSVGSEIGAQQMIQGRGPTPHVWGIDFTAGPLTQYGQPGEIEVLLAHYIYCIAGLTLLAGAGVAKTKGITNASLSFDGLSKSVGLQAGGVNGLYASLEEAYRKTLERLDFDKLRTYKRGLRVHPYGH